MAFNLFSSCSTIHIFQNKTFSPALCECMRCTCSASSELICLKSRHYHPTLWQYPSPYMYIYIQTASESSLFTLSFQIMTLSKPNFTCTYMQYIRLKSFFQINHLRAFITSHSKSKRKVYLYIRFQQYPTNIRAATSIDKPARQYYFKHFIALSGPLPLAIYIWHGKFPADLLLA